MALRARRPIQLLATEWAPKKPKVNTNMPSTTSHSGVAMVSKRPASISAMVAQSILRRPSLSASAPIFAEL
ncbi:hypothetical protein D3C80_2069430 [compost metagenome]